MAFHVDVFADEGKLLPLAHEDELFILERAKISFQTRVAGCVRVGVPLRRF